MKRQRNILKICLFRLSVLLKDNRFSCFLIRHSSRRLDRFFLYFFFFFFFFLFLPFPLNSNSCVYLTVCVCVVSRFLLPFYMQKYLNFFCTFFKLQQNIVEIWHVFGCVLSALRNFSDKIFRFFCFFFSTLFDLVLFCMLVVYDCIDERKAERQNRG